MEKALPMARYVAETTDAVTERYLEQVVRREKGMPWIIKETDRLRIREFMAKDAGQVPEEPEDQKDDRIFQDQEKLEAYIKGQYGFFGYGLWAVERKEDAKIIGKAGITQCDEEGRMELGYHIFAPYRRQAFCVVLPVSFVEVGLRAAVTSKSSAESFEVIMVLPETSMSTV